MVMGLSIVACVTRGDTESTHFSIAIIVHISE